MIDTHLLKSYYSQNNHETTGGSELYDIKFEDGYIMYVTECSTQILSWSKLSLIADSTSCYFSGDHLYVYFHRSFSAEINSKHESHHDYLTINYKNKLSDWFIVIHKKYIERVKMHDLSRFDPPFQPSK